uniref:Immunoglobulin V-set domain-containing protein n=1 Tax=Poecilia mexicana TaxID=48701 RepID=A0A3B3Z5Z1_9TELE
TNKWQIKIHTHTHTQFCHTVKVTCLSHLLGEPVTQTPTLWTNQDADATMQCSHTKGSTYRLMYWYQQLPGQNMKLIVSTTAYSPPEYDPGFTEEKFPAEKKNAETGSLRVKKVKPEDTYFVFLFYYETFFLGFSSLITKNTETILCIKQYGVGLNQMLL